MIATPIGRLDLKDDHPDTYTGSVTAWHQLNTPWKNVQLYAETLLGQPVELCTLDCREMLEQLLNDTESEVVALANLPPLCRDFDDMLTAYRRAIELLARTKCKGVLGNAIRNFLTDHSPPSP